MIRKFIRWIYCNDVRKFCFYFFIGFGIGTLINLPLFLGGHLKFNLFYMIGIFLPIIVLLASYMRERFNVST